MKKLIILSALFSVFFIQAQQLDESFLESLPDDVREDLIKRSDSKTESTEENYRSSQSSKIQQSEDLIILKARIEADLGELEIRLSSDDALNISSGLELFGKDFFSTFQTSFMPVNEPNPDSSYVLDVGDILNIQLTGLKDFIEVFPINGDGSINIPDIGINQTVIAEDKIIGDMLPMTDIKETSSPADDINADDLSELLGLIDKTIDNRNVTSNRIMVFQEVKQDSSNNQLQPCLDESPNYFADGILQKTMPTQNYEREGKRGQMKKRSLWQRITGRNKDSEKSE